MAGGWGVHRMGERSCLQHWWPFGWSGYSMRWQWVLERLQWTFQLFSQVLVGSCIWRLCRFCTTQWDNWSMSNGEWSTQVFLNIFGPFNIRRYCLYLSTSWLTSSLFGHNYMPWAAAWYVLNWTVQHIHESAMDWAHSPGECSVCWCWRCCCWSWLTGVSQSKSPGSSCRGG